MKRPDISIIASGINTADARLHRICSALRTDGLEVELFAPGKKADAPEGVVLKDVNQAKGFLSRIGRAYTGPLAARGQIIYSLSPEAVAPGWLLAKIRRRAFGVDLFEDYLELIKDRSWAQNRRGGLGAKSWPAKLIAKSALYFGARADFTTVADEQVRPLQARNRILLRNLPDLTLLGQATPRSGDPRAIYIGDIRASRGLFTMLDAISLAPSWKLDMVGQVAENDQPQLQNWLSENPAAAQRISWYGRKPPKESWALAQGAWVGLSLLEPTPAFVVAVPSKLYEYQAVGLAVISSSLPRCVAILEESGGGAVADDAKSVAMLLENWASEPKKVDELRSKAKLFADQKLSWARESAPILKVIHSLLSQNAG